MRVFAAVLMKDKYWDREPQFRKSVLINSLTQRKSDLGITADDPFLSNCSDVGESIRLITGVSRFPALAIVELNTEREDLEKIVTDVPYIVVGQESIVQELDSGSFSDEINRLRGQIVISPNLPSRPTTFFANASSISNTSKAVLALLAIGIYYQRKAV